MALQFTAKTLDYAKNPRNQGEIETPTAVGEVSGLRRLDENVFGS